VDTLSWQRQSATDAYEPGSGASIDGAARQIATVNYLGGSLLGTNSGDDLGLSRIHPVRQVQSGNLTLWDWTEVDTSLPAGDLNRYLGFTSYPVPIWNAETGDIDELYTAGGARKQLTELESKVLVWQGFLFDGSVVPLFSWREDKQSFFGSGTPTNANRGAIMFEDPEWYIPSGPDDLGGNRRFNSESAQTTSFGLVVHLPQSLEEKFGFGASVFYNESDNFQPDAGRVDPFGNPIASPEGKTKDYGFAISSPDNRFVFKVNWYETSVQNVTLSSALSGGDYLIGMGEAWAYMFATRARKAYDDNAPFADFNTDFDPDNPDRFLPYQPRAGQSIDDAYDEFLGAVDAFLANPPAQELQDAWGFDIDSWSQNPSDWINVNYLDGMAVTGDTNSEGVEFEFAAQITPNWNLTLNASKTTATRNNIAQPVADWVDERYAFYTGPAGNVRFWGPWVNDGESLKGKFTREFYGDYLLFRALEGANVPELRKWRFNLVTNYTFTDGFLEGVNIGGAYRWQDKVVIGYPVLNSTDPLDDTSIPSYDIANPYYGPTESDMDLWVGYERDLNESVRWRIQLNVRNAFSDNSLIPITAQPDGSPAAFRIKEKTSWFITNTFTF